MSGVEIGPIEPAHRAIEGAWIHFWRGNHAFFDHGNSFPDFGFSDPRLGHRCENRRSTAAYDRNYGNQERPSERKIHLTSREIAPDNIRLAPFPQIFSCWGETISIASCSNTVGV